MDHLENKRARERMAAREAYVSRQGQAAATAYLERYEAKRKAQMADDAITVVLILGYAVVICLLGLAIAI